MLWWGVMRSGEAGDNPFPSPLASVLPESERSNRATPSVVRRLPVLRADGGAAVRELSDRSGQPRLDRELHVQAGDLERPKDTSVFRYEDELAPSPGKSRQCLEQHPQSRGIDEVHVCEIHHRVARPVAENPIELLLESRSRECVDLSRHGDDVGARRELRGADLETDD